jgi:hypothetical protein
VAADRRSGYVCVLGYWTPSGNSHVTVLRETDVVTTMVVTDSVLGTLAVELRTDYAYLFESINDGMLVIGLPFRPPAATLCFLMVWK